MTDQQSGRKPIYRALAIAAAGLAVSVGLCGISTKLSSPGSYGGPIGCFSFLLGALCVLVLVSLVVYLVIAFVIDLIQGNSDGRLK